MKGPVRRLKDFSFIVEDLDPEDDLPRRRALCALLSVELRPEERGTSLTWRYLCRDLDAFAKAPLQPSWEDQRRLAEIEGDDVLTGWCAGYAREPTAWTRLIDALRWRWWWEPRLRRCGLEGWNLELWSFFARFGYTPQAKAVGEPRVDRGPTHLRHVNAVIGELPLDADADPARRRLFLRLLKSELRPDERPRSPTWRFYSDDNNFPAAPTQDAR